MKKLLMKLLGIMSASEQLARLERNQAVAKETMERAERTLQSLLAMRYANGGPFTNVLLDDHIDLIRTRLSSMQAKYAEDQQLIDVIRTNLEVTKTIA